MGTDKDREKARSTRPKRESSKPRDPDTKISKPKKPSESTSTGRSTRTRSDSKSNSTSRRKTDEKDAYTKPSPRTLRKSSSSNAKVDLKAKPPNTVIKRVKPPPKDPVQSRPKDGKAFSTSSKGVSKSRTSSRDTKSKGESSSSSRTSSLAKGGSTRAAKEEVRRRSSRDHTSSSKESSSKTSSKDSRKDRSDRLLDPKKDPRKSKDRSSKERSTERRESRGSIARTISKSDAVSMKVVNENLLPEPDINEGQLSLDTQESGISVSTPRPLSRDDSVEEEVEGSISSKYVEVDDAEEVDEMIAVEEEDHDSGVGGSEGILEGAVGGGDDFENIAAAPDRTPREENGGLDNNNHSLKTSSELTHDALSDSPIDKPNGILTSNALPVAAPEEEEEDPYGDDEFEDYDSDFEDSEEDESEPESEDESEDEEESEGKLTTDDEIDVPHTDGPSRTARMTLRDDDGVSGLLRDAMIESIRQDQPQSPAEDAKKPERPKTSKTFVNFAKLKEKHSVNQTAQADNRGLTLLSMISLDTISLDLLTLQPINYDAFISSYGLHNTQQVGTQVNEDNLSQESQTEPIVMLDKWTQQPISVDVKNLLEPPTPQDYLGVGGEMGDKTDIESFASKSSGNAGHLTKFLSAASQVVLTLLEEESVYRSSSHYETGGSLGHGRGGGGFSNHGVLFGGSLSEGSLGSLLAKSSVICIQFSSADSSVVATGHGFTEREESEDAAADYQTKEESCSGLICVWSVHEPSQPKHILRSNSTPKALAFSPGRPSLVIAGLSDSTLAVWDITEPAHLHPNMTIDESKNLVHVDVTDANEDSGGNNHGLTWRVRIPSFITACSDMAQVSAVSPARSADSNSSGARKKKSKKKNEFYDEEHILLTPQSLNNSVNSSIICLQTVEVQTEAEPGLDDGNAFQVVSLSSCGELVWWVVVVSRDPESADSGGVSSHTGASPWSRLMITRTFSYPVILPGSEEYFTQMGCSDFQLNPIDTNTLYVSTASGSVRHINRLNPRTNPHAFLPEMDPSCSSTCVCVCPHLPSYLLVGCSDGSVRLHSTSASRPLTTWPPPNNPKPVINITWSSERPCVFYVHEQQCIHVWDLSAGDMTPVATLDTETLMGEAGPMMFSLAPTRLYNRPVINAVFGSRTGRLILRSTETDFLSVSPEEKQLELDRFKFYATII